MNPEIFLIDTNSLITSFKDFYSFDIAPGFWIQLIDHITAHRVVILDMVRNEILAVSDDLKDWFEVQNFEIIDRRQPDIITEYGNILDYLQNEPKYKPSALTEWSKANVADPWLIAAAKVYGYTIVTFEKPVNANSGSPSKYAKIPDVAAHFNVKAENLYCMMRKLQFKLN